MSSTASHIVRHSIAERRLKFVIVDDERHLEVPFTELAKPGVFAAVRWFNGDVVCPACGGSSVTTHGYRKRGDQTILQFICTSRSPGPSHFFNEYTGTALADSSTSVSAWLMFLYLQTDRGGRLSLREISSQTGVALSTLYHWRKRFKAWRDERSIPKKHTQSDLSLTFGLVLRHELVVDIELPDSEHRETRLMVEQKARAKGLYGQMKRTETRKQRLRIEQSRGRYARFGRSREG